ncbi:MAG TPA: hypothetical protein VGA30_10955 [Actinomycetota bacterium]
MAAVALGTPAAAASASPSPLTASGSLSGSLKAGNTVQVRLAVTHSGGWQEISEVEVDLTISGKPLDQLVIDPTHDSVVLVGEAGPNALGEHATLTGTFFRVDAASIELIAKGERLTLTMPLGLRADPPAGARLVYQSRGFDLSTTRAAPLTPPVKADTGLSWGTLGVAIAGALFAGSFLGGLLGSRRRPPARPSIYRTVQRRLDEERAAR